MGGCRHRKHNNPLFVEGVGAAKDAKVMLDTGERVGQITEGAA